MTTETMVTADVPSAATATELYNHFLEGLDERTREMVRLHIGEQSTLVSIGSLPAYDVTREWVRQLVTQCEEAGVPVLRPPRDGRMAFVRSPDGISIELLQDGAALPPREPWASRENQGEW